jgi:mannosyltransferase OCH1-like enzyme
MIPKIAHCIWVGNEDLTPHKMIYTWRVKHFRYRYILWDNEKIFGRKWHNQHLIDYYKEREIWHGVADVARYEILHEMGGFMHGADSECLHNIDELFDPRYNAFSVYENEIVRPGYVAPLYACSEGNKFAKTLIDELHKVKTPDKPWKTTGNLFMMKMIEKHKPKRLKIWDSHTLIPVHHTGLEYKGTGKVYAKQMWGTTKKLYGV